MPVYRNSTGVSWNKPFYDVLNEYLATLGHKGFDLLELMAEERPDPDHHRTHWRKDVLVLSEGRPLVAIAIFVNGSSPRFYTSPAASIGGVAGALGAAGALADRALEDMRDAFTRRIDDELPASKGREAKDPTFVDEMRWSVVLRAKSGKQEQFGGGPFDLDQIDKAMQRFLDLLVDAAKSATSDAPKT